MGIALILALNTGISVLNAWAVGYSWAKSLSTWEKIVNASAFIMSGCGFTSVIGYLAGLASVQFGWLDAEAFTALSQLVYVGIILPVLGTGIIITLDSAMTAIRTRKALDTGVSLWNVYAQARNTMDAIKFFGPLLDGLGDFFSSDKDDDDNSSVAVVAIAIGALVSGFVLAFWIATVSYSRQAMRISER